MKYFGVGKVGAVGSYFTINIADNKHKVKSLIQFLESIVACVSNKPEESTTLPILYLKT
jgi:hypothetical protein